MKGARFKVKYIVEREFQNGIKKYEVNEQAYLHILKDHRDYLALMSNTEEAIQEMYSYLGAVPKLVDPNEIRISN